MTVMTLIPSTFQRIMNPLVDSYRGDHQMTAAENTKMIENAILESRIFIMELALCFGFAFLVSQVWIK